MIAEGGVEGETKPAWHHPKTMNNQLAEMIEAIEPLIMRFVIGFDTSHATTQPDGLPNHLIWQLGHLALYNHRAAERISETEMSLGWDPEPFSFDSCPVDDPAAYPGVEEVVGWYRQSLVTLAAALRQLPPEALTRTLTWGKTELTLAQFVSRMIFHNGTHCGQLLDIRRKLDLPKVIS